MPEHSRCQLGYAYGGQEIYDHRAEFLHTDGVSQGTFALFYAQLATSALEGMHVVIADGATFIFRKNTKNCRPMCGICNRGWIDLDALHAVVDQVLAEFGPILCALVHSSVTASRPPLQTLLPGPLAIFHYMSRIRSLPSG